MNKYRKLRNRIVNRHLRRAIPVKGNWYYEMQIGKYVLMWRFSNEVTPPEGKGFQLGRFYSWVDPCWHF